MGYDLTIDKLLDIINLYQDKDDNFLIEYMCHPGYISTIGDLFSKSKARSYELSILKDKQVINKFQDYLISTNKFY